MKFLLDLLADAFDGILPPVTVTSTPSNDVPPTAIPLELEHNSTTFVVERSCVERIDVKSKSFLYQLSDGSALLNITNEDIVIRIQAHESERKLVLPNSSLLRLCSVGGEVIIKEISDCANFQDSYLSGLSCEEHHDWVVPN